MMLMPIGGLELYPAQSTLLPGEDEKRAAKAEAPAARDSPSKPKTEHPIAERRGVRSRLLSFRPAKKEVKSGGAPAQENCLRTASTWASDAATLVPDGDVPLLPSAENIVKAQVLRCDAHHERSIARKLRDRVKGMATLSSTEARPAFQVHADSPNAVSQIVHAAHWELQRTDPANIDPVELAHAVACVERWRSEGHQDGARDAAIGAWLSAFSLDGVMSVQSLTDSYAAGSTGYEHKGKGIATNLAAALAGGVISATTHASAEAAAAVIGVRTLGGAIAAGFDAGSGAERFKRLPQEELAALMMVDTKSRASQAPEMRDALRLARKLHRATRKEADDNTSSGQAQLLEYEQKVKARLNISAEEWVGKKRELPVRALATGMTSAGAAVSLAAPPAAAALPALVGASAVVHASYRLMGWDRADARDRLRLRLFNHIKSYSWAVGGKLASGRIARRYAEFEAGKITREELAAEVRPLLVHPGTGDAIRFPAELRLARAEDLLRGKLARVLEKELKRRRKTDGPPDSTASMKLQQLLADLSNLQSAKALIVYAGRLSGNGFRERAEATLRRAEEFLQAVSDTDMQSLFTGDIAAQTRAAAKARAFVKGEASRFKYGIGIGAVPAAALTSVAASAGGPVNALAGSEAASGHIAGSGAGAVAFSGLSVTLMFAKAMSREDVGADNGNHDISLENKPAGPQDFSEQTFDVLLSGGRMPASITFTRDAKLPEAEWHDSISDLSATEPYARADRRRRGIGARLKIVLRRVADGTSAGVKAASEPFLRQAVSYYMRRSRKSRRERQVKAEKLTDPSSVEVKAAGNAEVDA